MKKIEIIIFTFLLLGGILGVAKLIKNYQLRVAKEEAAMQRIQDTQKLVVKVADEIGIDNAGRFVPIEKQIEDAWGNPLAIEQFASKTSENVWIRSAGPDETLNTEDDIVFKRYRLSMANTTGTIAEEFGRQFRGFLDADQNSATPSSVDE